MKGKEAGEAPFWALLLRTTLRGFHSATVGLRHCFSGFARDRRTAGAVQSGGARRKSGVPAMIALAAWVLSGCQNSQPRYGDLTGVGIPVSAPAGNPAAPNHTGLNAVTLNNQIDPAWLRPPTELFTLGPGDKLEIELLGEPTSRTTTIVAPDGKIYFNLLPGVDAWGLTIAQAKQR